MANEHVELWESEAEAQLLESRLAGFWNPDYLTRIILPLLDLPPGARVLDVGAGTGSLTLLLAQALSQVHFLGVDITLGLVIQAQNLAQKLNLSNVAFQEADALHLPFGDASFEAAVCQTLLIHLGNPGQAVQEMSRVLKPGGSFMAVEYHTLHAEWPIDTEQAELPSPKALETAKYTQMLIKGYRSSGQGDLKAGGRIPFLARKAGLEIWDIRINDRVSHAFPPYRKASERAALVELQSWGGVFQDAAYRSWISGALLAGGGLESDVTDFFNILDGLQSSFGRSKEEDYAFLWLINPVLLITIARKK